MENDDASGNGVHAAIPATRFAPGNSQGEVLRFLESLPALFAAPDPIGHRVGASPTRDGRRGTDADGQHVRRSVREAEEVSLLRRGDFGPRGDHPPTQQGASMIHYRFQTPLIESRPPPTSLPVRAPRKIDEHCDSFCTAWRSISPRSPAVSALCSVTSATHAAQATIPRKTR